MFTLWISSGSHLAKWGPKQDFQVGPPSTLGYLKINVTVCVSDYSCGYLFLAHNGTQRASHIAPFVQMAQNWAPSTNVGPYAQGQFCIKGGAAINLIFQHANYGKNLCKCKQHSFQNIDVSLCRPKQFPSNHVSFVRFLCHSPFTPFRSPTSQQYQNETANKIGRKYCMWFGT